MSSGTREKILNAALELLERRPGEAVRMSDIAKASGISRQALYLHFTTRAELLIAAARHLDELKNVDRRLAASRSAASGIERLDAFIDAWGDYIPEIYGVARAFMALRETDEAARAAWSDRMQAVRHGCEAAIRQLAADDALREDLTIEEATDLLWTLLSVRNWEQLRHACGWSQRSYIRGMRRLAHDMLLKDVPR